MAKKIILYLSSYNEKNTAPIAYACPNGDAVEGIQTNDAPVKYLLREHEDISEAICLVTPEAREKAWAHFQGVVREASAKVQCREIPIEDGTDFARDVLPEILSGMKRGDKIFLETTGGFRDAVMHLLLISRALSYAGVRTTGAVYSNFNARKITDAMPIVGLFDLIGGMQEASSFGNVRTLREYYRKLPPDGHIEALLDAMEALWETIALCRTEQLPERMEAFNGAMEGAERHADPLMRALLPAFRQKYGGKMTVPGVIKWCLKSDMLQQALTIYRERIPFYILHERSSDILSMDLERFLELMTRGKEEATYKGREVKCFEEFRYLWLKRYKTAEESAALKQCQVRCSEKEMRRILNDYRYIQILRNHVNHANGKKSGGLKGDEEYLYKHGGYKNAALTTADDVRKALLDALSHLQVQSRREAAK